MKSGNFTFDVKFGLARVTSYDGNEEIVEIPSKLDNYNVFQVEAGAFTGNDYIKKVIFPKTIGKVFPKTFIGCSNLETVELSFMDEFPEESMFMECPLFKRFITDSTRLACQIERQYKNVKIECMQDFKITPIDEEAKTAVLNKVRMRSNELIIPDEINGYKIVELGFKLSKKDKYSVRKLIFPKFLKKIPKEFAYDYQNNFDAVIFNDCLEEIGDYAFCRTKNNGEYLIPKSVKVVGDSAFKVHWSRNKVKFEKGSNIEKIGSYAFSCCEVDFNGVSCKLTDGSLAEAKVHNFVVNQKSLPVRAFYDSELFNVSGLDKVTDFGVYSLRDTNVKDSGFKGYTLDLTTNPVIDKGAIKGNIFRVLKLAKDTKLTSDLFKESYFEEVIFPDDFEGDEIPDECFCYSKIKHLKLPKTIKKFGNKAFYRSDIESINLENIEVFGDYCFYCSSLKEAYIGENVSSLGKGAFSSCSYLSKVIFDKNCKVKILPESLFEYDGALVSVELSPFVEVLGDNCFYNCNKLETINLGNILKLGRYAFGYCSSINNLDISKVTEIPNRCFYGDKKLENIKTGKLISIGNSGFSETAISKFNFNDGLISIKEDAFRASKIEEAILPDSLTELGAFAFLTSTLRKMSLGKGIKEVSFGLIPSYVRELNLCEIEKIYEKALLYLQTKKLVIPKTCTYLADSAICESDFLEEVYMESTLDKVRLHLFDKCPNLKEIHTDDIKSGRTLISRKNTSIEKIVPISPDVKVRTRKKKASTEEV